MNATRRCGCGEELEVEGDHLRCPGCGAAGAPWLVELDGVVVGAADQQEVLLSPGWVREQLGVVDRPPDDTT